MTDALRLIVFDVDGTLVDSQNHIHDSMIGAFESLGLAPPPLDAVLSIVGLSLPEAIARLAPGAEPPTQARLVDAYKAGYFTRRSAGVAPLYPGAREAVTRLAAQPETLLGIATGKSRRGLDHVLSAHGLDGHFVTRQVADDHPSKPHPSMLLAALSETGMQPARAVMIGDTSYDIEMGRAAGMATIGVAWGYHAAERLAEAGAGRIVADFAELETALAEAWEIAE
ncbi:HAD-IA family hydrolase [Ostreiculturibacter nitratireducens]|uniref:HAD-IA family hydrolase n=1 Tax=Ostreiculturibacter nitratireducens TaxID=3075226 RepID=UPI0031B61777